LLDRVASLGCIEHAHEQTGKCQCLKSTGAVIRVKKTMAPRILQPTVSSVLTKTLFNEMRQRRPDLARVLFERIETDRRGEVPVGQKPYFCIPVFNWYAGLLSTVYQCSYIESARRFPEVAPLTLEQLQALDLFDAVANNPAMHFQMELRTGDIQLVHDHTLLHDRTAFEDWPEPERQRHLLRLWLAPERARPGFRGTRYGSVVPGQRGGIVVPGTRYTILWEAEDVPDPSWLCKPRLWTVTRSRNATRA